MDGPQKSGFLENRFPSLFLPFEITQKGRIGHKTRKHSKNFQATAPEWLSFGWNKIATSLFRPSYRYFPIYFLTGFRKKVIIQRAK
jgi:hypothetical protein